MKYLIIFIISIVFVSCSAIMPIDDRKNLANRLQLGDIVHLNSTIGIYSWWGHTALYLGNGFVGEYPQKGAGFRLVPIMDWLDFHKQRRMTIIRPKNYPEDYKINFNNRVMWMQNMKYDAFSDKDDTEITYCSLWIWQIYRDVFMINIDSDGGKWVLPNDILKSKNIRIVDIYN